jgi:hypothetical protein
MGTSTTFNVIWKLVSCERGGGRRQQYYKPFHQTAAPVAAVTSLMKRLLLVRHAECEMNLQTKGFVSV